MKKLLIKFINWYQVTPLGVHKRCKYIPTCSEYMKEAVDVYGFKGFWMGIWRILRCNPFSKGGFDPVPIKKK